MNINHSNDLEKKTHDLFIECIVLDQKDRIHFLEKSCKEQPDLKKRVEELLILHNDDAESALSFLDIKLKNKLIGTSIDHYEILDFLGEGGFGIVYLGKQIKPIKRLVAVKVIKPGMDSKLILKRFKSESQTLSLMDHPDIVQIFDSGTTEDGKPYFVMEYVDGIPLTKFCDKHRLSVRERIKLIIKVCNAMQHAHAKGVIHRDLKPSNILAGYGDPGNEKTEIEIIDFGVSKVLNPGAIDNNAFTSQGQLIGTPDYMSPEQAEMSALNIDTRSDIYSIGAILYQLACGQLLFDQDELRRNGRSGIEKKIRNEVPLTPSKQLRKEGLEETELQKILEYRDTDLQHLRKMIDGDLSIIIMKCLEKDRSDRYQTCLELKNDLENYLEYQPISARPKSKSYIFKKYIQRNKKISAIATLTALFGLISSVIIISLITIAIFTTQNRAIMDDWFYSISTYLIEDGERRGTNTQFKTVLAIAANGARDKISGDQQLMVLSNLAKVYLQGNEIEEAKKLLNEIEQELFKDGTKGKVTTALEYQVNHIFILLMVKEKKYESAIRRIHNSIEFTDNGGMDLRHRIFDMQYIYDYLARLSNSEWAAHGYLTSKGFNARRALATCYARLGEYNSFIDTTDEIHSILNTLNDDSVYIQKVNLRWRSTEAQLLLDLQKYDLAIKKIRESIQETSDFFGPDSDEDLAQQLWLPIGLYESGDFEGAASIGKEILIVYRDKFRNTDKRTLSAILWMALIYKEMDDRNETMLHFKEHFGTSRSLYGHKDSRTLKSQRDLGIAFMELGFYEEAEAQLDEAYVIARQIENISEEELRSSIIDAIISLYEKWNNPEKAYLKEYYEDLRN